MAKPKRASQKELAANTPASKPPYKSVPPIKQVYCTEEEVTDALRTNKGLIYRTAQSLGISYATMHNYLYNRYPALQEVVKEAKGLLVDKATAKLEDRIEAGEMAAIIWTLKTLGKDRGWVEHQNLRIGGDPDSPPIQSQSETRGVLDLNTLPLDLRRQLLDHFEQTTSVRALPQTLPHSDLPPADLPQPDLTQPDLTQPTPHTAEAGEA